MIKSTKLCTIFVFNFSSLSSYYSFLLLLFPLILLFLIYYFPFFFNIIFSLYLLKIYVMWKTTIMFSIIPPFSALILLQYYLPHMVLNSLTGFRNHIPLSCKDFPSRYTKNLRNRIACKVVQIVSSSDVIQIKKTHTLKVR